jgi:predicted TIM-barrel fold metal-dependent hydrolase
MKNWNRRNWMKTFGSAALVLPAAAGPSLAQFGGTNSGPSEGKLPLTEYEPKSMLHVAETQIERPRFPVIDIHTHLGFGGDMSDKSPDGGHFTANATPAELIPVMERRGLKMLVNLTGGCGNALRESLDFFHKPHPDRFLVFTEPWWQRAADKNYPQFQADQIEKARQIGARGLKVLKILGLYLREKVSTGPLVKVDDPRFDPMWETVGALKMPVTIHVSDPEAFFLPIDKYNERYEELHAHPDWSFHGDFPSNREIHEARNRVVARHPKTQFILCHVGNAEDLAWVSQWLNRYPNLHVEIGARIGELGRQPGTARKFFEKYQDRILFGTDAVPRGEETPQQLYNDQLYQIYYRFLETEDEYFDYAPARIPPQGRWRICGLGLPESILKKVYHDNAARLLSLV